MVIQIPSGPLFYQDQLPSLGQCGSLTTQVQGYLLSAISHRDRLTKWKYFNIMAHKVTVN